MDATGNCWSLFEKEQCDACVFDIEASTCEYKRECCVNEICMNEEERVFVEFTEE